MNQQAESLALDQYGCRLLHKAVCLMPIQMQITLVRQLEPAAARLMFDANGNLVLQKCIMTVPKSESIILV